MSDLKEKEEEKNNIFDSIAGEFFFGKVEENKCFPFPTLSEDQKEMAKEMINAISKFAEDKIDSEKLDIESVIPEEVFQGLAELGLFGLGVPEEFGGLNLDYTLYARVFSEISSFDGSIATTLGAHQSIGYRALLNDGNDKQKEKWLPLLSSGEVVAAFCLTEPGSGSDAYSIKTKAVNNGDGTFTISGQKLWITNGGTAGFYSVFCKTDHEVDGKVHEKISCFIVEKEREGLSFGEKENKMGIRASETRAVYFDKVVIPEENLIGELGKGFKIAMNVLNSGRLSLGSGCVGGMKTIIKLATDHAYNRKQFNKRITEFGLIQDKISSMVAECYAAESIVYMTTGCMVNGMEDYQLESAICKVFSSESLWRVVDQGMQIAAGCGYMKEYPYERIMRDARINLIFEGTNEILRCFIALAGVRGPSENLAKLGKISDVSKALQDPVKSLGVLTNFATDRISKLLGGTNLTKPHPRLEEFSNYFSDMLSEFALQVDRTLIKYKKTIIDFELPQARLANMVIELYVYISVLSRSTSILESDSIEDSMKDYIFDLTKYICTESRHRFIGELKGMSKNLDKTIKSLSDKVCEMGGYGLDIVDY
jgi:acyl-CoA dehydrogenase family protein 9